jgi:hypothetical protein
MFMIIANIIMRLELVVSASGLETQRGLASLVIGPLGRLSFRLRSAPQVTNPRRHLVRLCCTIQMALGKCQPRQRMWGVLGTVILGVKIRARAETKMAMLDFLRALQTTEHGVCLSAKSCRSGSADRDKRETSLPTGAPQSTHTRVFRYVHCCRLVNALQFAPTTCFRSKKGS